MTPGKQDVRPYGYRDPRIPCPLSLHLEVTAEGTGDAIPVRGIDVSASGVAIAVGDEIDLADAVELTIRCGESELGRIPGRVYHQSQDHYGLEFKFVTDEQRQRVQELIAQFIHTI